MIYTTNATTVVVPNAPCGIRLAYARSGVKDAPSTVRHTVVIGVAERRNSRVFHDLCGIVQGLFGATEDVRLNGRRAEFRVVAADLRCLAYLLSNWKRGRVDENGARVDEGESTWSQFWGYVHGNALCGFAKIIFA